MEMSMAVAFSGVAGGLLANTASFLAVFLPASAQLAGVLSLFAVFAALELLFLQELYALKSQWVVRSRPTFSNQKSNFSISMEN